MDEPSYYDCFLDLLAVAWKPALAALLVAFLIFSGLVVFWYIFVRPQQRRTTEQGYNRLVPSLPPSHPPSITPSHDSCVITMEMEPDFPCSSSSSDEECRDVILYHRPSPSVDPWLGRNLLRDGYGLSASMTSSSDEGHRDAILYHRPSPSVDPWLGRNLPRDGYGRSISIDSDQMSFEGPCLGIQMPVNEPPTRDSIYSTVYAKIFGT